MWGYKCFIIHPFAFSHGWIDGLVQVRKLAEASNLPTMLRKDSQGICFLGKLKFDDFLHHYLGEDPGEVVYLDEMTVVGKCTVIYFPSSEAIV